MMITVDKLVADAAKLPPLQLSDLVKRLSALVAMGPDGNKARVGSREDLLFTAIAGRLQIKSSAHYTNSTASKSIHGAIEQLNTLISDMTPQEWASITDLVAQLTVEFVEKNKFQHPWVGVKLALTNLRFLLNNHFPGYASSNLLRVVLKLRVQKERSAFDVRPK